MNMDEGGDKGWFRGPSTWTNARLTAAASDMLEALQSAEAFIAGFEDDETQKCIRDNLLQIRAAIAQTTKA